MKTKKLLILIGLLTIYTFTLSAQICTLPVQNDDNPIILQEEIIYEDGNAIVQQRDAYTYNEDKQLITHTLYERKSVYDEQENETDSLVLEWIKEYTYLPNSDKILTKTEYEYFEQQKIVDKTWDYTYHDNGCLKMIEQKHFDKDDNVGNKYVYYYNSSCSENSIYTESLLIAHIERDSTLYYEDWGEGLQIFQKYAYEYDALKETTLIYYMPDGTYQLSDTFIRERDDVGNIVYTISTETYSDHLHESFYTYNENNNLIQLDHYAKENFDSTKELYNRDIYDFNEQGDLIYSKYYHRNHDLDTITPFSEVEYTYTYDEIGNALERQEIYQNYDYSTGSPNGSSEYTTVYNTYCDGLNKGKKRYSDADELDRVTNYYYLKGTDCENENLPPLALTAYPNPATNYITFNSDVLLQENSTISLYDVTGKLLWQESIVQRLDRYTLSTQSLPKGMYLVRVISGEDVFSQKFFKE